MSQENTETYSKIILKQGKVEAWITRVAGGTRYRIKILKRKPSASYIYWDSHAYQIDLRYVFIQAKNPILVYDVDICEPLTVEFGEQNVGQIMVHKPLAASALKCHWSKDVELTMKHNTIRMSLGAMGKQGGLDATAIMFIVLAALAGVGLGIAIQPYVVHTSSGPPVITTVTTARPSNTTTTHSLIVSASWGGGSQL